jgi:ABC-type sugar transport system substrate-binding protein
MSKFRSTSRRACASLVACAAVVGLAACGSNSSSGGSDAGASGAGAPAKAGKEVKIGVMLFTTNLPFYAPLQAGIKAEAAKLGADVDIQDGQLNPARQAQLVQQFVTEGKDAIIISASDADAVVPAVRLANQHKIPVLGLTNDVGKGASRLTYVGTNNVDFGKLLGQGVKTYAGATARVALIMGALGTTSQRDRTAGFKQFLAQNPGIKLVASQAADWDNAKALKVGQDFLNKYPQGQLDAIVAEGPEGAAPAKYALKSGRTDVKFIVGDISSDVQQQLKAKTIAAAVFQNPYQQGVTGVRYAVMAARGKPASVPSPFAYQQMSLFGSADWSKIPSNALF